MNCTLSTSLRGRGAILDAIRVANKGLECSELPLPDGILRSGSYLEAAIWLGSQLADALANAHERGIYHRDLKPSNILMSVEGRPLLLDFNLSVDERLPTGRIGGTLPYMAPEELTSICDPQPPSGERRYEARSDLFSLGVIIYELLTGSLPFGTVPCDRSVEETAFRLRQRQAEGPDPIRRRNPQVEKRMARLIESCLAFEPAQRPQTARQLAAALRRELAPSKRGWRWVVRHRWLVLSALAVWAAMLLAGAAYLALRPPYDVREYQRGLAYYQAGKYPLALDSLNNALRVKPNSSATRLARAQTHQRLGDFHLAFEDYQAADRLAPNPITKACKAYCLNRLGQHEQAISAYRHSLEAGYNSPAVLNNLGFSWLELGQLDDAESYLREAIKGNGMLQAARHNLVLVFLKRAVRGQTIPREAFVHAARAIEIGPESAELYRDVAALYAIGAKRSLRF